VRKKDSGGKNGEEFKNFYELSFEPIADYCISRIGRGKERNRKGEKRRDKD
jgi:hypothetical protein